MASGPQLLHIAFAAGIDQSQQTEVLDPTTGFTTLENVRQLARGAVTKRWGFTALALTRLSGSRSAGYRHFSHEKTICVSDGTYLDAYAIGPSVNVSRSLLPNAGLSYRYGPAIALMSSATPYLVDMARCNGVIVYLYNLGGRGVLAVEDAATGTVLRSFELVANGDGAIQCLGWYSTYVVVFGAVAANATVTAAYLDTSSLTTINTGWVNISSVATNKTTTNTGASALSVQSLSNRIAFAYVNDSAGTSQVTVKTMTIGGVVETQTVNTSSVKPTTVAVEGSIADTLWVAWNETTAIKIRGLDADALTATAFATTATMATCNTAPDTYRGIVIVSSSTAGAGTVLANDGDGVFLRRRNFTTSGGAATTSGSETPIPYTYVTSRAFNYGGRYYAVFYGPEPTNTQQVAALCDFTDLNTWVRPVAEFDPSLVSTSITTIPCTLHLEAESTGVYYVPLVVIRSNVGRLAKLFRVDFNDPYRWTTTRHGAATFISAGVTSYFDGHRVAEVGFLHRPHITATDSGSGSGLTGTYRYVAVYEEVDSNGNWCQSGVSDPTNAITISSNDMTVTVRPITMSARHNSTLNTSVRIAIYRTLSGGEAPYYRLAVLQCTTSTSALSHTDQLGSDTTLAANAKLYRQPGIVGTSLDRRPPPHATAMVSYGGMLCIASGPDVHHSGQDVLGEETWFSPVFQVPIPGPGDLTALAAQDGTLFAFKRDAIYALAGEAPSDNGQAGGLGVPRRLAVDVGAIGPHVATTALGTFFVSNRGLELLTRAQTVEWIGEKVQETFAAFPYVRSMTVDAAQALVYIECASAESAGQATTSGRTFVFDLSLKEWVSTDRRKNNAGAADTPAQSGAMIWNGSAWRYSWLGADGRVYVEDQTTYLDPGSAWVTMRAETAWFKVAGIQGQHQVNQVLLLARKNTRADLSIYHGYDYITTYEAAIARVANDLDTLSTGLGRIQVYDQPHENTIGQSIRIKLEDATPTGGTVSTGQGATWIALTIEHIIKPGAALLPESAG